MEAIAKLIVLSASIYLGLGLLFALPFLARGLAKIDPAAVGTSWGFRLLILPGVVTFWPLMALRWLRGSTPPHERNAHRDAAEGRR